MKRHNLFIDEQVMEKLKALAQQGGTTYSNLIREAIKQYLEAHERNSAGNV
jgi:predicted DNA-binding protein